MTEKIETQHLASQQIETYEDEPSALCCSHCGMELEWTDCDACDDGQVDVYNLEPLWYDPGDTEPCSECGGDGGWLSCPNAGEKGHQKPPRRPPPLGGGGIGERRKRWTC